MPRAAVTGPFGGDRDREEMNLCSVSSGSPSCGETPAAARKPVLGAVDDQSDDSIGDVITMLGRGEVGRSRSL
jgi:hypothetical protein